MRSTGRRSLTRRTAFLCALSLLVISTETRAGETFLIPGVALSDADLQVGAWCRYLVVDAAAGQVDSSVVYIAVTGRKNTPDGEAYWIEFETYPRSGAGGEAAKALIFGDINKLERGDSLSDYIAALYIKRGEDAAEPADPTRLDIALSSPASDSTWALTDDVVVATPTGRFRCREKTITVEDKREIPMKRFRMIKNDRDDYAVWLSDEIPIFHMVRCEIDRVRESRTIPHIPGIPDAGKRQSKTTAVLIGHGLDARSKLAIEGTPGP